MNFIIGVIIIFAEEIFVNFGSSMIILSLVCGIPLLKKAKQEGIVFQNAPNKYIVIIITWLTLLIGTETILFILLKKYFYFLIIGIILGLLNGISTLKTKNNQNNVQDFLKTYEDYLINQ